MVEINKTSNYEYSLQASFFTDKKKKTKHPTSVKRPCATMKNMKKTNRK